MVNVGDIIRVTLFSGVGTETFLNIYHYEMTTVSEPALVFAGFRTSFEKYWLNPSRPYFSPRLTWKSIKIENLSDVDRPFQEYPLAVSGTATGEDAPNFVAVQYKLVVGTRKTRAGYKRYSGLTEGAFSGNQWLGTWFVAMRNFEVFHGNPITIEQPSNTVVGNARPIVLKKYTAPTPTSDDWQAVSFANIIDRPTTQNTRKIRGI